MAGNLARNIDSVHMCVEPSISAKILRSRENDSIGEIIAERQRFLEEKSGSRLNPTKHYSFGAESMAGNCEQFFGVTAPYP
jgi:hypothetical protein